MNGDCVSMNIFDEETIYEDCTVQILKNSQTGEESVGWWKNEGWHIPSKNSIPDFPLIAFSKENNREMIGIIYWDEGCDCFICEDEGILMFDVTHWRYLPTPPND